MPHFVIEYSSTVEQQISAEKLIQAVHQAAIESTLFNPEAIKLRVIPYHHFKTGVDDNDFIHVTARILSGRTLTQRQMLSAVVLKTLQNMSLRELSFSVEVVEMKRESYSKAIC